MIFQAESQPAESNSELAGQAEAIELVKIEGLSISEAASASGQSESLVKVNIHRGLKRLAASIESE